VLGVVVEKKKPRVDVPGAEFNWNGLSDLLLCLVTGKPRFYPDSRTKGEKRVRARLGHSLKFNGV
jgi:hypothetical protein